MMSTRFVTISYAVFVSGLSLILYALFIVTSDLGGLLISVFRTLGSNAILLMCYTISSEMPLNSSFLAMRLRRYCRKSTGRQKALVRTLIIVLRAVQNGGGGRPNLVALGW